MTNDQGDEIAHTAFFAANLPPAPRSKSDALRYITKLLSMLPPAENFGYVKGPAGGENVEPLPDGTLVRVSRVMYPNGQIVKVMSDAPNGNPQWVYEDVRLDLFIKYSGPHESPNNKIPDKPPVKIDTVAILLKRIETLENIVKMNHDRMEAINTRFDNESKDKTINRTLPLYEGEVNVFGYRLTVISHPKIDV